MRSTLNTVAPAPPGPTPPRCGSGTAFCYVFCPALTPFKHSSEEPTQQTSVEKLVEALWPSILAYDFVDSVRHANCPLLFIQGELDQATPAELLEEKLEVLPKEGRPGVVHLSGQGHFPFWENAEGFAGHVKKFVESL